MFGIQKNKFYFCSRERDPVWFLHNLTQKILCLLMFIYDHCLIQYFCYWNTPEKHSDFFSTEFMVVWFEPTKDATRKEKNYAFSEN